MPNDNLLRLAATRLPAGDPFETKDLIVRAEHGKVLGAESWKMASHCKIREDLNVSNLSSNEWAIEL